MGDVTVEVPEVPVGTVLNIGSGKLGRVVGNYRRTNTGEEMCIVEVQVPKGIWVPLMELTAQAAQGMVGNA